MRGISSSPITGSKTTGPEDPADPFNTPSYMGVKGQVPHPSQVDADFFTKDLPERVRDLLTLLVQATPGISSELVPGYVEAVAASRKFMSLVWPGEPA